MLRVGLTGELGSGKSTVAAMLAARGAHVFSSDQMGRAMMQPGQPVFAAIVAKFGSGVVGPDGTLDRGELARLAFDPAAPRVEELNAIVHPAVLGEQARLLAELEARDPRAIAVVESALIFSTRHAGERGWCERFDAIVLVTAPRELKLQRFVERQRTAANFDLAATMADGERRLATQAISAEDAAGCLLIDNSGPLDALEAEVEVLWKSLEQLEPGHR